MNSLERARQFLAQKASRLALAIVPLAALAISTPAAKAGPITSGSFSTSVTDCRFINGSGTCQANVSAPVGGNPNFNSVSMSGSGISSGGSLYFFASDSGSGTVPSGSIPVSWDFSVNSLSVQDPIVNWDLFFKIDSSSGLYVFSSSGSAATGTVVQGTGSINVTSGGTMNFWQIQLTSGASGGSFNYGITIPGGATLDLNPSAVPEPASLLLIAPGLGALLLLRRKKRR